MSAPFMLTSAQAMALDAFVGLDPHLWYDEATALSCIEIEAVVGLLRAFGASEETCTGIIEAHAEGDDEGDSHWRGAS